MDVDIPAKVTATPGAPGTSTADAPVDVTVVVIFKDEEAFLEEAIASVDAQAYRSWELLLVDDGSVDGSTAIARRHAEQAARPVRYIEHPGHANRGMSASRNLGISEARGEFIAFLDADDVLVPDGLAEMVAVLKTERRVGMVYGPLEYWYGWTRAVEDRERDFVYPVGVSTEQIYEPPSLVAAFLRNTAFVPSGMLTRRSLLEAVGGCDESFRDLYEDQVIAAKLCLAAPVYVSGRCWYRYRQHENSSCLTAQREGRLAAAREPFLRWLVEYLERQGQAGSEAWSVARDQLRARPWRARSRPERLARRLARMPRALGSRVRSGTRGGR